MGRPPKHARHREGSDSPWSAGLSRAAWFWPKAAYVVPVLLAMQDLWRDEWSQSWKWFLIAVLTVLGVALPKRLEAIGEGRAMDDLRDDLQAAKTLANDVVDTATTGLNPLAVSLEALGKAGRRADKEAALGDLQSVAVIGAKTLAPRGVDENEGVRACLYLWSKDDEAFVRVGRPRGRSDFPRERFTRDEVSRHGGFRRMFAQNVPQVDSDVDASAKTILGNPAARYKSFVSAAVVDASRGNVYGFISVDHTERGRMDRNDGLVLQTICQLLAAGLAQCSWVDHTTVPHLTDQQCNTRSTSQEQAGSDPTTKG